MIQEASFILEPYGLVLEAREPVRLATARRARLIRIPRDGYRGDIEWLNDQALFAGENLSVFWTEELSDDMKACTTLDTDQATWVVITHEGNGQDLAHEIGHAIGRLHHHPKPENLMYFRGDGRNLDVWQVQRMSQSRLLKTVPQ